MRIYLALSIFRRLKFVDSVFFFHMMIIRKARLINLGSRSVTSVF